MTAWPFTTFIRASQRHVPPKRDKAKARAARAARKANRRA